MTIDQMYIILVAILVSMTFLAGLFISLIYHLAKYIKTIDDKIDDEALNAIVLAYKMIKDEIKEE